MDKKEFSKDLEKRTLNFAVDIIKLSSQLSVSIESKVIRNQITKSATSIGANYREANRARSKADFKNRIKICESEASETQYWIEIIQNMNWINMEDIDNIFKESGELLAIFSTISKKLSDN
ncbi:MAG: four helix bundle protein [Prolixibacteraceae bacterium]|nr:four helix bundle protein [Prolixibacteraceae bacterium]MBN2774928.1 four helix bundle protein [Prolixibacteraceae bacterium]